ncbi:hypothetical protein [Streptomyces sp. YKOK-I1]
MNPEPLVRAMLVAMMLLEECGPDEVDPDTAVRGLEHMGYELLQYTDSEREEFRELLERMASSEGDAHMAEFIRGVPFAVGLTEEQ